MGMARVCCICDKKIGILDSVRFLEKGINSDYEICDECNEKKKNLSSDYDLRNEAIEYFRKYLKREEIDDKVKKIIQEQCRPAEGRLQELLQKKEDIIQREKLVRENYLVTSGNNLEGYNIIAYKGIVSGEVVLGTGILSDIVAGISDFFGEQSDVYAEKIMSAKKIALKKLLEEVIKAGGNAVIGVDFDYITFTNNIIGVSANGTAVFVEKIS